MQEFLTIRIPQPGRSAGLHPRLEEPVKTTLLVTASSLLVLAGIAAHAGQAASTARTTQTEAAKSIDVCTVLPVAQAAQLSGQHYTTAAPTGIAEGWTSGCAYNNDDATAQGVTVNIDTGDRAANTWNFVHTGNLSKVSGVGDKALWDKDNTLYAMSGTVLIQVNGLESQDKSEAIAKAVIHALH